MCWKCDSNLTEEQHDRFVKAGERGRIAGERYASKVLMNGIFVPMDGLLFKSFLEAPETRFTLLREMIRKAGIGRLRHVYQRLVKRLWCSRKGHNFGLMQSHCVNCDEPRWQIYWSKPISRGEIVTTEHIDAWMKTPEPLEVIYPQKDIHRVKIL